MGMIVIEARGSFAPSFRISYSAMEHGHAVAVDDAIKYLQGRLVLAQEQDERLRSQGHAPSKGFAQAEARGLLPTPPAEAKP